MQPNFILEDLGVTAPAGPEVSVVTPALDPETLDPLARHLDAQTMQRFEWVLVDDGSRPQARDAFRRAAHAVRVPVRLATHSRRHGQAAARNLGVALARADWIKFVDADDGIDAQHLEALHERAPLLAERRQIAFAPTRHVYPVGRTETNITYRDVGGDAIEQLERLLLRPFLHHGGGLYPRDLLSSLGPYDPDLVTDEDGDLLIRILLSGWTFEAVPGVNYLYVHHDGERVSRDDSLAKLVARRRVCDKLMEHFIRANAPVPRPIRRALARRLDRIAMSGWRRERVFAKETLAMARALHPGYPWVDRRPAGLLRAALGPGPSLYVTETLRGITRALRSD